METSDAASGGGGRDAVEPSARARALVLRHGWNATAYQILNPGIDHWFGDDAVVGYVARGRVRVVAGAPVCAVERLAEVAGAFERDASSRRERVCYFCVEARLEAVYRDSAAHAMVLLGTQPVWDPEGWAVRVEGKASLRAQLQRARNKGVVIEEWLWDRAAAADELRDCLREWLATKGLPALHFLVEPETLDRLADRRTFVATREGRVVGFLVASPVPAREGWLIEQVVRRPGAPNGTAELLLDTAVRTLAESGSRYVTFGLAPLSRRGAAEAGDDPLWLRGVLGWVRAHGRRFYNFRGLEAFKAKFEPDRWEPVYAVANEASFSPATLYAVAAAFGGCSPVVLVARAFGRAARAEVRWIGSRFGR